MIQVFVGASRNLVVRYEIRIGCTREEGEAGKKFD